jgi:hypothetical protein
MTNGKEPDVSRIRIHTSDLLAASIAPEEEKRFFLQRKSPLICEFPLLGKLYVLATVMIGACQQFLISKHTHSQENPIPILI